MEIVGSTTTTIKSADIRKLLIEHIESKTKLKVKSLWFPVTRVRDDEGDMVHVFEGAKITFQEIDLCGKD